MVACCCAASTQRDASQPSDVKRSPSPWFYQQPLQLSHDTAARHLIPGRGHLQVYITVYYTSPCWFCAGIIVVIELVIVTVAIANIIKAATTTTTTNTTVTAAAAATTTTITADY